MRVLRHIMTGRVKNIRAWVKQYDEMRNDGDLSGIELVKEQMKYGILIPVKHKEI